LIPNIDIKKVFRLKETSIPDSSLWLFGGLALSILFSVILAIFFDELLLLAIPAGLLLVYQTIVDYKKVFYLFLFSIPLSTEYYFPNGFSTDLPTEPLVVGLMLAYGLFVLMRWQSMKRDFLLHPITLFLLFHIAWLALTVVTSANIVISLKFLLAKIWYVAVCYFLAGSILKTEKDIKKFFWIIFIPFIIAVVITLYRHSTYNFSFEEVKYVMQPCFRNHVTYAAILAVFLPFILLARKWYKHNNLTYWGLVASAIIFVAAVYLSYTRTAYISLIIAWGSYFLIRLKLMKIVSLLSVIILFVGIFKVINNNSYLEFAPDFETTVSHTNFDDLVNATAQGQDVSTMERVYRWVAAMQMSKESKLVGYGPGNFHDFYKPYAVSSFETYVSDNPEKSGIHCYYLMVLVEQGIPGALIFLGFTFFVLIKGEEIYHQCPTQGRKDIVMALMLSIIIIDAFLLINDMVETDKVGSLFFMNIAMLINMDFLNKRDAKKKEIDQMQTVT
jgi:O-antigen ligase